MKNKVKFALAIILAMFGIKTLHEFTARCLVLLNPGLTLAKAYKTVNELSTVVGLLLISVVLLTVSVKLANDLGRQKKEKAISEDDASTD